MPVLNDADDVKLGAQDVTAIYAGTELVWIGTPPSHFSGGVEYVEGGYRYHMFRLPESGQQLIFMPDADNTPVEVEYCIIGGGGAGGNAYGNGAEGTGGGAGGMLTGTTTLSSSQAATVGAGGNGREVGGANQASLDWTGKDSSLGALVAFGGGRGWGNTIWTDGLQNGGSGGGGKGSFGGNTLYPPGTGVAGQGFAGGLGDYIVSSGNSAGGGGAGGPGGTNANTVMGSGGPGKEWPAGSGEFYAAGGGGGAGTNAQTAGAGGSPGGGGAGGEYNLQGEDASGPGSGGGGGSVYQYSGSGGDGVIFVRYLENAKFPPVAPDPPIAFSGGVQYWINGTLFTKFGSSGTVKVYQPPTPVDVDFLVVSGGGSGGGGTANSNIYSGGGGGAGGVLTGSAPLDGALPVIVGAGGTVGYQIAYPGGKSSVNGVEPTGGGAGSTSGGASFSEVTSGGSGGGGYAQTNATGGGGSGIAGQGFNGASGRNNGSSWAIGGGGGGQSEQPANPTITDGSKGGNGLQWLDGQWYAGGGGGAAYRLGVDPTVPGPTQSGRGGGGIGRTIKPGSVLIGPGAGTDGMGAGGGGTHGQYAYGGAGGNGVVVLAAPVPDDPFPTPDLEAMSGVLREWFDASDNSTITLVNTNQINEWRDKSAAGIARVCKLRYALNARPVLGTTLFGKQSIDFSASGGLAPDDAWIPPVGDASTTTIFFVYQALAVNATGRLFNFSDEINYRILLTTASSNGRQRLELRWTSSTDQMDYTPYLSEGSNLDLGTAATDAEANATKIVGFRQGPPAAPARRLIDFAGGQIINQTYSSNQPNSQLNWVGASGGAQAFQGQLMEYIRFDQPLTDGEMTQIGEYLRRKWAVA